MTAFALISIVPSSLGNSLARLVMINYISIFPIYTFYFLYRFQTDRENSRFYNLFKIILPVWYGMNIFLALINLILPLPILLIRYLSLYIFYLALILLFVIFCEFYLSVGNNKNTQLNLPLIYLVGLGPIYFTYIFPSNAQIPFFITVFFILVSIIGVLHFLTTSRLIANPYRMTPGRLYLYISLFLTVAMVLINNISQSFSVPIVFLYCFILVYSLLPIIEESLQIVRKQYIGKSNVSLFIAVEKERENISTMIHDTIIQDVILFKRQLSQKDSIDKNQVLNILDEVIYDLRELCSDTYSLMIQEIGLENSVMAVVNDLKKKHPVLIDCKFEVSNWGQSPEVNNFLLRSMRELMINSIKHGEAKFIDLFIRQDRNYNYLTVKDDGFFKEREADQQTHLGLDLIEEKLRTLGGELEISHGNWTEVTIKLPKS